MIHRDLAARNILLTGDIQPKISDFGYSRAINNVDTGAQTVSDTGPLKWMSPVILQLWMMILINCVGKFVAENVWN